MKRWLWLIAILYPLIVPGQQPRQTTEQLVKTSIDDDETYAPKLDHPAYLESGPVVLLDEGHGNSHFDKAFVKLVSMDGYRVVVLSEPFRYEELSKAKVLVIMNPGMFMPLSWHENPQPLFTDVEAAAVKDWLAAGGSLLFAAGSLEAESGDMLLNRLGIAFSQDMILDRDLRPANGPAQPSGPQLLTFTREKEMLAGHSILAGRMESERVDTITLDHASSIVKAPDNVIALVHCSEKAVMISRDWLVRKQEAEAHKEVKSNGATESQPITVPSFSTPAPKARVAVAFTLGKGRVVVIGNGSFLSSVLRQAMFKDHPLSQKVGLGDGDNQKFTLNIMHWLSGLLE